MDLIKEFLKKGMLLSPDVMKKIKPEEMEELINKFDKKGIVLTDDYYRGVRGKKAKIIEEYKTVEETKRITTFVDFYNKRFEFLRDILKDKLDLEKINSINKLNYGEATVIGMVKDVKENGFKIEDPTGSVFCISDEKVIEDEVIAVKGAINKNFFHVEKVFHPDIPLSKKVNATEEDCYGFFTKNISKKHSHKYSHVAYIFTFGLNYDVVKGISPLIVTKKEEKIRDKKILGLNTPFLVDVEGIKVFVFEMDFMDKIKKKLGIEDEKKILISLLKRRHLLPYVYMENDPYLLKSIPDIIFFRGGSESFFLNYKGVSVISVSGDKNFLVNLKTREFEEVK